MQLEGLPSWDAIVAHSWRIGDLSYQLKQTQREVSRWWNDEVQAVLTILHARRGFGKTWFLLTDAFETMAKQPGCRLVYAAPSREMAKSIVIPTAHLLIPRDLPDEVRPVWFASEHAFIHPNGSRCVVEGADDDHGAHLRGPFAHRVYMDELGFWRYCDYVYRSVLYPQVERTGGRMLGVSTSPESPHHEFASVLIPEAKTEGAYVKISLDDDYTVTDEQKAKIATQYSGKRDAEEGRNSTQFKREYLCELVTETERAVLPEFNIELHVSEFEHPEFHDRYVYMDQGFVDLTHCLFAHYNFKEARIVIEDEIAMQHVTISELAPLILEKERELWGDGRVWKRASDSPPISLAEFARQHMLQPKLVPKEIRFAAVNNREPDALINRTRAMLDANRIRIHPRCKELIKQCQGGLYNERRTDYERIAGLGHLDGVSALSYLVDGIDYSRNPETAQRQWSKYDFPVEQLKVQRDVQMSTLARLLPKVGRKPEKRSKPYG